jgi:hypothetical protein
MDKGPTRRPKGWKAMRRRVACGVGLRPTSLAAAPAQGLSHPTIPLIAPPAVPAPPTLESVSLLCSAPCTAHVRSYADILDGGLALCHVPPRVFDIEIDRNERINCQYNRASNPYYGNGLNSVNRSCYLAITIVVAPLSDTRIHVDHSVVSYELSKRF